MLENVPDPTAEEQLLGKMIGDLMPYFTTQIIFDNTNVRNTLGDEVLNWKQDLAFLKRMAYSYYKQEMPDLVD